ncbi:MAG: AbgT family transporter [Clostridia bacterium]|nr:AbgT family transporter [Clostridia bacterium]
MNNSHRIQLKSFLTAAIILLVLLVVTGIIAVVTTMDSDTPIAIWRIATAPIESLWGSSSTVVIIIIVFILVIGGSINVLRHANIIEHMLNGVIKRYKDSKYTLLLAITLMFMAIGALFGVFEEIVPLVPIMIILAKKLGWDTKTGLGMSILATGFGFSAAITNPFTIGIAQNIVGLPLYSGIFYRVIIFIIVFFILYGFLYMHSKKVEIETDEALEELDYVKPKKKAVIWVMVLFSMMMLSILASPFITFLQDINLVLITLYFLLMGIGVSFLSYSKPIDGLKKYIQGSLELTPGIVLVLIAFGINHLITISGTLDQFVLYLTESFAGASKSAIISGSFGFTLIAEFFISSGSAKAAIILPILDPVLTNHSISSQLGVLAYQLGDGFTNMFYPTNPVLLVTLGLAGMSYTKWFKWTFLLQLVILLLSVGFLLFGLIIGY